MKRTGVNPVTEAETYRGYLIRYSARVIVREGREAYWIEKGGAFIGWARSVDDAKQTIGLLTDTPVDK